MRKLALWFGLLVLGGSGVANGTVIYDANQYFAGNELAAETNPFGPFSVGHFDEAILGGFTPFTSAEHTNSFRDFNAGKIQGYFIDNDPDAPGVLVNVDSVNSVVTDFGTTLEPLQIHLHPGGIGSYPLPRTLSHLYKI